MLTEFNQALGGEQRQFSIRADDLSAHATNIKGMAVWEGEEKATFRWRVNYERAIKFGSVWEVLVDGVSQGTLTVNATLFRSPSQSNPMVVNPGSRITIRHPSGDATGKRCLIVFREIAE